MCLHDTIEDLKVTKVEYCMPNANVYIFWTLQWISQNAILAENVSWKIFCWYKNNFQQVIYRHYHIRKDEVLHQCKKWQKELESAVEKYHDDTSILKQIKAQLSKISQLLPTLQHVLYNSINLSEFEKKDNKNDDKNSEENP